MYITKNSMVTLDYTVTDADNHLIDSGAEPIVYLHGGYGSIFDKLEHALEGKTIGENVVVKLNANEAFGEYQNDLVLVEPRSSFDDTIAVDQQIEMIYGNEEEDAIKIIYTVTAIEEDSVILDGNHPLSGLNIIFDTTVIAIRKASEQEINEHLDIL
ncbi:MAG: peptidylprolyl isomerase [Sulfurospirillaceae bacterium]|nr:peptidylprolyl isomerase [Sulfurospirillaceae bacterium]MDD2827741.1 peptidylprolyl isomerase [Sulfurospirillaceae bacterium]